jgi:hypothetical protein
LKKQKKNFVFIHQNMSRSRGNNKTGVQKKSDHESGFFEEENHANYHSSSSQGGSISVAPIVKKKKGRPPKKKMMVHSAIVPQELSATRDMKESSGKMNLRNNNNNNRSKMYQENAGFVDKRSANKREFGGGIQSMIQIKKVYEPTKVSDTPKQETESPFDSSDENVAAAGCNVDMDHDSHENHVSSSG